MYLTLKRAAGGKKRGGGGGVTSGLGVERKNARVWHGVGGWGGGKSQVTSIETGLGKPWEGGGGGGLAAARGSQSVPSRPPSLELSYNSHSS